MDLKRWACVGLWTQHAWIFWMNTSNSSVEAYLPWQSMYAVLSVALALFALLAHRVPSLIFPPQEPQAAGTRKIPLCPGGLMAAAACSLAVLLTALANIGELAPFAACVGLVVGAMGLAWLYLCWGAFYGQLPIREAAFDLFAAGMIAALIKIIFAVAPFAVGATIAALLGPCSYLCSTVALTSINEGGREQPRLLFHAPLLPALWKIAVLFIVFSIANAAMLALQPPSATSLGTFLAERLIEFALCGLMLLYLIRWKKPLDFVSLWRIVLILLCTDFLLNILMPASPLQPLFAGVSLNFIVLFVWLVLADIARHSSVDALLIFGFGWGLYTLPFFLGSLIIGAGGFGPFSIGLFAILLYSVAVVAALCLESRDQNISLIFDDLQNTSPRTPEEFATIDERCAAIAATHHLTAREVEVMQMLARGRSKAYIAETLFVTENTVKGHTKRLYAKLDVHSKKELQQLIDAY